MSKSTVFILAILILTATIRFLAVLPHNFAFTMDQGRDMLDIRQIAVGHKLRLVGPTTSINGVLLGPFWYYYNLPPFVISGGDPSAIMAWQIISYQLAGLLLYLTIRRSDQKVAILTTLLYLFLPIGFNTTRYFWNANAMVYFTAYYLSALVWATNKQSNRKILILGLIVGLCLQIEAAFAILFLPFTFLVLLLNKIKVKSLFLYLFGFAITLIPQVIFEFRHGFFMTKLFLSEIFGKGDILGQKLTLAERLIERKSLFLSLIHDSSHITENALYLLYIFSLVTFVILAVDKYRRAKLNPLALISFLFVVFAGLFYIFGFAQQVKVWYPLGLSVFLVAFLSSVIVEAFRLTKHQNSLIAVFVVLVIVISVSAQRYYLSTVLSNPSNDKSNLKNELAAVDYIYNDAATRPFSVYTYLPSIYDFPYQYLFWWYGTKTYGYQPGVITYQDNAPEYIQDNSKYWTKIKKIGPDDPTYLLIEVDKQMPIRQELWQNQFVKSCQTSLQSYPWGTDIKRLGKCSI